MTRSIRVASVVAASLVFATFSADSAQGQIIVGRGGGGVSISVPGLGGVRLGAPLRMRGAIVAPYGVPYGYGYPYGYGGLDYVPRYSGVTRYVARPIGGNGYAGYESLQSLPTAGELRAMDDSALLNAVVALAAQLDADLQRFDTGATWQNYLRLPEDALPPAGEGGRVSIGVASLSEALKRFELTEANPRYVQISGLPSFASMHAALAELVGRVTSAPTAEFEATAETPAYSGVAPPATPTPPALSNITASSRGYEPQSIEMRNLHAAPVADTGASGAGQGAGVNAQPAAASSSNASAEELPSPPPSLVAPQNDGDDERSILSR
jgi:hypothetical protein